MTRGKKPWKAVPRNALSCKSCGNPTKFGEWCDGCRPKATAPKPVVVKEAGSYPMPGQGESEVPA